MNIQSMQNLGYTEIKEELKGYAVSYAGRRQIEKVEPMIHLSAIQRALEETAEAKDLLEKGSSIPLPLLEGMETILSLIGTGYLCNEQDLTAVATFLNSCSQLRKYMASKEQNAPRIATYAASLQELRPVQEEINRCIRFGSIEDGASKGLERARRKLAGTKERIHKKLGGILSRHQSILQESIVSMRSGRYVLAVKREYHKHIKGAILDQSTSGQTVFIEPDEIAPLHGELDMLMADEAREEEMILSRLTAMIEQELAALELNIEVTGTYDFIFAKAKYGRSLGAVQVKLNEQGYLRMQGGRHPMLKNMVPIHLEFGTDYKSLIITGPNTGGKTVVLKTLGLLTLMVQSGLLIPVEAGSEFSIFRDVMSVIGDGQSLEQSLSTFSAQMKSIETMLRGAGRGTLLLIDELAAGTDPGEGIALSIAILEELNRREANIIVTTHFNELKKFASATPGFQNARMEFNQETLQPMYRLTIGEAGSSYALQIAEKLGIGRDVILRSRQLMSEGRGSKEPPECLYGQNKSNEAERPLIGRAENSRIASGEQQQESDSEEKALLLPEQQEKPVTFEVGDAVYVSSLGKRGIVFEPKNSKGMVGVMIQKQKMSINHKRLKPYLSREELYPEDYDFDIIFESKENRKKRKLMNRKHVEGLMIIKKEEDR